VRMRRLLVAIVSLIGFGLVILAAAPPIIEESTHTPPAALVETSPALEVLETLVVKGRAPKTGYSREQFGNGWAVVNGCDTRNIILYRDLVSPVLDEGCTVISGILQDSYTGKTILFSKSDGSAIQIDHVIALSNAWQTGAQQLTKEVRTKLANDPLELIAVDGQANQEKGDGDAATWLPPNKAFRCEYIARQIAVKQKYALWVTQPEKDAMRSVLNGCPNQRMPQGGRND
jgi:hypothetical protein